MNNLRQPFRSIYSNCIAVRQLELTVRCYSVAPISETTNMSTEKYQIFRKTQRISKAMEAYIKRTKETAALLQKETAEFELGKRHLANMMGLDPEVMNQADVDEAIEYLLPSGLFSKRSRPTMKPPGYYYPEIKPAEFSEDGRPHDHMFFTTYPRFYGHLYDVYEKISKLDDYAKKQRSNRKDSDAEIETKKIIMTGTKWLDQNGLNERFVEKLTEQQARQFEAAMEYLVSHPYAYLEEDFIHNFRTQITATSGTQFEVATEVKVDEQGRSYAEADGRRKNCNAYVKVYHGGSGKFTLDGRDLTQFVFSDSKEQLLFPFLILNRWEQFDVVANTENGRGESERSGAVRLAICKALCPFLGADEKEKLRIAGLLTRDPRRRERNKWQHIGSRAKPVWKRR